LTVQSLLTTGDFAATGTGAKPCNQNLVLAAGASCTMSVTFSPAQGASGVINGGVAVTDTAAVSPQILDAKGTAVLPLTFTPMSLTFGPQTVGTASASQTVTLTNNLTTSISPNITGNGDFSVIGGGSAPCTSTLAAKATCTLLVGFTPSAVGTRASTITVTDLAIPSVQTMVVTGTGQ
jgi:hypothetical protein